MSNAANANEGSLNELIWDQKWGPAFELLRVNPDAAKEVSDRHFYGMLPLHSACYFKAPSRLIEEINRIFSDAAKTQDRYGCFPIHKLFEENEEVHRYEFDDVVDEETVHLLVEANPSALLTANSDGCLPLHIAANNPYVASKSVLRLISAYPEAASIRDSDDDLPMHIACCMWNDIEDHVDLCQMLGTLLEAYPDAVFAKGSSGQLPLSPLMNNVWSCMNDEKMNSFNLIFKANPEAAKDSDNCGNLPMHHICDLEPWKPLSGHHPELFSSLMKVNPGAAFAPNNKGELPLHLACKWWSIGFKSILHSLIAANPGALNVVDNMGFTPVDYAMKRKTDSNEFVRELFSLSSTGVLAAKLEQSISTNQELTVCLAAADGHVRVLEKKLEEAEITIKTLSLKDND